MFPMYSVIFGVAALSLLLFLLHNDGPDLGAALTAAAGQTVQPGDFDSRSPRTIGGGGSPSPAPAPAPAAAQPGTPGGPAPANQPAQPGAARPGSPAGGQPQPRPAAPFAGQQPAPNAVPLPGQPAAGAAANQPWNLRSQLAQLGFDTSQVQDDQGAWGLLAQRLAQWNQSQQQNAQYAQYGQFYLANKAKFDALMAQGATPGQAAGAIQAQQGGGPGGASPAAPAADRLKNLFGAPEFNPEWAKIVQMDPQTGKHVVPMGYDPSIGPKMDRYVEWRRETFETFLQDPMKLLGPALVPMIQEEAKKLAGQAVGGYGDQQFAVQYVNSQPWMFQADQNGQRMIDPVSGQPLLTQAGLRFRQYVASAERNGITDIRQQATWATAMVERDAALWQLQQMQGGGAVPGQPAGGGNPPAQPGTPAAVNAQQQQQALGLNGARRIAGGGGNAVPATPATPAVKRPLGRGSLKNRLQGALQQAGIN